MLAKKRGVQVIYGRGYFEGSQTLRVETEQGQQFVNYDKAIIAVGSKAAMPKAFDLGNPRIMTSTEALEVEDIPENLLVVGGGYIGMELGTVYATLGSKVVLVEALDTILLGADPDLARPVHGICEKELSRKCGSRPRSLKMATSGKQIKSGNRRSDKARRKRNFTTACWWPWAACRTAEDLGLENTKVELDEKGFIKVNDNQRDRRPGHLRHRRHRRRHFAGAQGVRKEARIAVEAIIGEDSTSDGDYHSRGGFHRSRKWPGAA